MFSSHLYQWLVSRTVYRFCIRVISTILYSFRNFIILSSPKLRLLCMKYLLHFPQQYTFKTRDIFIFLFSLSCYGARYISFSLIFLVRLLPNKYFAMSLWYHFCWERSVILPRCVAHSYATPKFVQLSAIRLLTCSISNLLDDSVEVLCQKFRYFTTWLHFESCNMGRVVVSSSHYSIQLHATYTVEDYHNQRLQMLKDSHGAASIFYLPPPQYVCVFMTTAFTS